MSVALPLLLSALTFGLGWAIRGHFGHEWGASWAGAMGALAVLVASRNRDWMGRAPVLTALGAIGWAVGGMMSYGIVVGYCRGTDFFNVAYGYAMLAVIGGLYGFIGGGLFGLGLETTNEKKPKWPSLLAEMVAGAWIFWGFIIYQLEWKMTPPRSELWAACLGAAAALAWYCQRARFHRALRVAAYSALGGGFGFFFGNFLQVMGNVSGTPYNWWNVMEFSLGFCGGLGMAYAVLSSDWPRAAAPSKTANGLALILIVAAIPLTNFIVQFEPGKLLKLAESMNLSHAEMFVRTQNLFGWILMAACTLAALLAWRRFRDDVEILYRLVVPLFLFFYGLYYTLFGHIVKGFFYRPYSLRHSDALYLPVLVLTVLFWLLIRKKEPPLPLIRPPKESAGRWTTVFAILIVIVVLVALISINSHADMGGAHERF